MPSLRSLYLPAVLVVVTLLQLTTSLPAQGESQSIKAHAAVNLGPANVCPAGQKSPKPCSQSAKVKFSVTTTTSFGPVKVVTQGDSSLDFNLITTTCTGTLSAGSTCGVTVNFTPTTAGARNGGIQIMDSEGNLISATYIYGIGQAPLTAFNPGVEINLPLTGYTGDAMALDAAGNVYFAVNDNSIAEFDPVTGTQTTVASGVGNADFVQGMTIDGEGNIVVSSNNIIKIAAVSRTQTPIAPELNGAAGIAADGRGNLYIGDDWDNWGKYGWPRIAEISAKTGKVQTLLSGDVAGDTGIPFLNLPWGAAVDSATNAYVACYNFGPVFESLAGTPPDNGDGIVASRQYKEVGNFANPSAVTVDAAGDAYVVDGGVIEVQVGTGTLSQIAADQSPFQVQMAMDAAGNLYFPNSNNSNEMVEAEAAPAPLNFGSVQVGGESAPQSITIQNIGNEPLNAVTPGLSISAGFVQVPGSGPFPDCTASFSLAPGAACNLSISFEPKTAGTATGNATFTDNSLNNPKASQAISLQGIGK
ncbi:MAG: choice-of-anchor D domain-containing protein [Terriglobales bacterium]